MNGIEGNADQDAFHQHPPLSGVGGVFIALLCWTRTIVGEATVVSDMGDVEA